jgi:DNA-binding response OmpR family regulator
MPDMTGLEALREIRKLEDPPEVVMLTADNSLSTGIEAMRHGAYDYLTKPATLMRWKQCCERRTRSAGS